MGSGGASCGLAVLRAARESGGYAAGFTEQAAADQDLAAVAGLADEDGRAGDCEGDTVGELLILCSLFLVLRSSWLVNKQIAPGSSWPPFCIFHFPFFILHFP
jgi:hypothetical protein